MGWQWHQLDRMQIIRTTLQTDNHTSTSPLSFYRPDALTADQPTASKHWSYTKILTCIYHTHQHCKISCQSQQTITAIVSNHLILIMPWRKTAYHYAHAPKTDNFIDVAQLINALKTSVSPVTKNSQAYCDSYQLCKYWICNKATTPVSM